MVQNLKIADIFSLLTGVTLLLEGNDIRKKKRKKYYVTFISIFFSGKSPEKVL